MTAKCACPFTKRGRLGQSPFRFGFFPIRNGQSVHVSIAHRLTSASFPQQQSRHFFLIARNGLSTPAIEPPFLRFLGRLNTSFSRDSRPADMHHRPWVICHVCPCPTKLWTERTHGQFTDTGEKVANYQWPCIAHWVRSPTFSNLVSQRASLFIIYGFDACFSTIVLKKFDGSRAVHSYRQRWVNTRDREFGHLRKQLMPAPQVCLLAGREVAYRCLPDAT
jgi:hypothetical protein